MRERNLDETKQGFTSSSLTKKTRPVHRKPGFTTNEMDLEKDTLPMEGIFRQGEEPEVKQEEVKEEDFKLDLDDDEEEGEDE